MKQIALLCFITSMMFIIACGSNRKISKRYTMEDKTVFELVKRLTDNPADKEAAELLPAAYEAARIKRKAITDNLVQTGAPGDKYIEMAREWMVLKQMYNQIKSSPGANAALPDPWDPSLMIQGANKLAAEDYYNAAMTFLGYNTRQYAQKAYDNFQKAAKASPGYKDVDNMLLIAAEKATTRVLVNPVNYNSYSYGYYGFQNDWMQQQMVRDLNARSYANTRFFTEYDLRAQQLVPDKIVDLNFTDLFIDNVHTDSRSYQRSKEIVTGQTKTNPPRAVTQTVYATVTISRRYMSSYATLECRIYDRETNNNSLYDRFSDRIEWVQERATYTGDRRALTPQDIALISNRWDDYPPNREQLAESLVRKTYQQLLSRISSGVNF